MAVKKSTYRVDNGTGWDEHMLKTLAEQVFFKNGKNLEDGFTSSLGERGYQKLPSGLILQWVRIGTALKNGRGCAEGTLPITFNSKIAIMANIDVVDSTATYTGIFNVNANFVNNGYYNAHIANLESSAGNYAFVYILALGR